MNDDVLQKFVENMRNAGQSDEMIAESLIGAGHNEIFVLNALGVENMSQLRSDDADDEVTDSQEHIPSAYTVVDEDGNPLISSENLPKDIGAGPSTAAPAKPRRGRTDAARRARPRTTTPQRGSGRISEFSGRTSQTTPVPGSITQPVAPAEKPVAPSPTTPAPKPKPEQPKPVTPPAQTKPIPAKKKLSPLKQARQNSKYQHHTFDDFMGRIKSHKEIEAGNHHALTPDHTPSPNEEFRGPVKPLDTVRPRKKKLASSDDVKDIDGLLRKQRDEVDAGPTGPAMDDLLDKKDLDELQKSEESQDQAPKKPVDLEKVPETPELVKAGKSIEGAKNSLTLKVVVILIGVLTLVGLAASVISRLDV